MRTYRLPPIKRPQVTVAPCDQDTPAGALVQAVIQPRQTIDTEGTQGLL
jgi:hypothetical protein